MHPSPPSNGVSLNLILGIVDFIVPNVRMRSQKMRLFCDNAEVKCDGIVRSICYCLSTDSNEREHVAGFDTKPASPSRLLPTERLAYR